MTPLHRLARRASRRLIAARFLRTLGVVLPISLGLGALGILVDRLIGPGIEWWWAGVGGLGLALIVAGASAWRGRADTIAAASEVDQALKLKDRLASAIALEVASAGDPFASLALDEATALAKRVRVEQAIPVRPERSWWWWPVASAALIGIGIFVPQMRLLEDKAEKLAAIERVNAQQKTNAAIKDASKDLEETLKADASESGDFKLADELTKLADLQKQMQEGLKDPQEAAAQAASQIDDLAQQLDDKAAEAQNADQAAQAMMDKAGQELAPKPGTEEVDRMIEAMRKGDMEEAAKAAEDLEKALDSMSAEDAERAADRLQQFADAMDKAAQQAQQNAADQAKRDAQDMANRGLSQQSASQISQNAQSGASQSQLEKQLQDQGISQEAARELAKKLTQSVKQQQANNQASKNTGECSQSMRQGAKSMRESKGGSHGQGGKQGSQGNGSKSSQSGKSGQGKAGQQGGSGDQPGDGEGDQPGDGQPSGNGKGKGGAAPSGKGSWSLQSANSSGAGKGSALHNLKQELNGAAKARLLSQQQAQQAQQLRVTKNDLLRQLADKSLLQKQQWLEQELAQGNVDKNWKYADSTVDVREGVDDGQVIAQQYTPGDSPLPYNPNAVSHRELTNQLSTAMEATERAIEDRVIPSRYRNIQRYFQKSIQRAKAAEPASPTPPAPDAADANPTKKDGAGP